MPRSLLLSRSPQIAVYTCVSALGFLGCTSPEDAAEDTATVSTIPEATTPAGGGGGGPGVAAGQGGSPVDGPASTEPPSQPVPAVMPSSSDGPSTPVPTPPSVPMASGGMTGGGGFGGGPVGNSGSGTGGSGMPGPTGEAGMGPSAGGAGGTMAGGGASGLAGGAGMGNGLAGSGGEGPAPEACPVEPPLMGGDEYCSNTRGNAGGGFGYELWAEGGGTGCMTVHGVGAAFSAEWNDVEDFLARVGLDFDQTRTHDQIGTIYAEFSETHSGSEEGLTYVGIYGWTTNPLREFYILEDWGAEKPAGFSSDGTPRDEVGTIEVDGETYDVWKKTRENKPAITGDNMTFDQYFSIRRTARKCGRISVSEHFNKWEEFDLPLGNLYEVKLLAEAQFNSGSISFTSATVAVE
jgi:endo-1,4-beta-xylanase